MTARPPTAGDDSGASLIIAMIFVTLVGTVSGVLLSFADTGLDTTIQLRKQAAAATTADGAAEVAIDALREGSYSNATGQGCFGSSSGLALPDFPATGGSAFVACTPDAGSGSGSPGTLNASNTPANAILSLGGISASESGVQVTASAASNALVVKGGVFSDSAITVTPGTLQSDTSIIAQSNLCNPASAMTSPNTNCASSTVQTDPAYPPLTGPFQTLQTVPNCPSTGGLVTFSPGQYTDSTALSACDNDTMWFKPGVYYFNFASGAPTWVMNTGALVGGTATATLTAATPAMPGSCVSPLTSTTASGVQFIFGGVSALDISGTAKMELCGSYSATAPPIALYGLSSKVPGQNSVPAESGCIVTVAGCPVVSSSDAALNSVAYVQGTIYAPKALVALSYGNSGSLATGQFVKDGVIARSISAKLFGVSPTGVAVPTLTTGPRAMETDVFLQVYVCPGVSTCSAATGRLRLESKVGVSTATPVVPGARSVRVYSWAVQR